MVVLTFREAVLGVKKEVIVERSVACSTCAGSGARPGSSPETCAGCRGQGQVSATRGPIVFTTTCPKCHGRGTVVKHQCADCGGAGERVERGRVMVTFPAGIDDGMRVRVAGQGEPGLRGGPAGNLYVDVQVEPDEVWRRDGADLHVDVAISFRMACLGGELDIPTIDGDNWRLVVQPGTQPGEALKLRRRGVPRLDGGGRGDLIAVFRVDVPRRLPRRARKLLEDFDRALQRDDDEG